MNRGWLDDLACPYRPSLHRIEREKILPERMHLPLALTIAAALTASGCAPATMRGAMHSVGRPAEADGFAAARSNPLSAAAHYETAMSFLTSRPTTRGDLEMALSGFQTAARLAPDLWEPLAGAAIASYQLGNFREAMNLMGQAIERRGSAGPLAMPFALLAYRAGEPELARVALAHADRSASIETDRSSLNFLEAAFSGTSWRPVTVSEPEPAGAQTSDGQGVVIEAYLIRETRQSGGNRGLNLLDGLSVQFGGTLLNYNYDLSGSGEDARTGSMAVTAPAISYSLNLASNTSSRITLEASPLVLAREGHKSKFLEGGSVLIVPLSDDSQPIERDVGITLEVTPQRVGAVDVDLDVVLEMSNITGQSEINAGRGASLLETDKTHVEVSARVPYGKAIVVGSADSLSRRSNDRRSVTGVALPGLSTREQSVGRRDVLVVLSVRSPGGGVSPTRSAAAWSQVLFGTVLPPIALYGCRPSEAPAPNLQKILPNKLN